jgi:hypothetical protein
MVTQEQARLIAEYERLREKLFEVESLATAIDHRLVELEKVLPENYIHPRDRQKRARLNREGKSRHPSGEDFGTKPPADTEDGGTPR